MMTPSVSTETRTQKPAAMPAKGTAEEYNHIKCVVAVMSGKGGVGKSLVTGLLASALAQAGYYVGILDADITGPSIPKLFGLHGQVKTGEFGLEPLQSCCGIKIISMNLLLDNEDQPVIWRGPMISKAITQLWGDVMWGNLDYLLVDLPPGTSDAALTIMQALPLKGVVMVTTPQGLAALIVSKAVHMAQKVGVPIIGTVENMAYFVCPDTGKRHEIFGKSHSEDVVKASGAPLLAQIPIDPVLANLSDEGKLENIDLKQLPLLLDVFLEAVSAHTKGTTPDSRELPQEVSKDYSAKARQIIKNKENMGVFETPDARGKVRGWCGDSIQIDLRLDGETIWDAVFTVEGCGATIACGSMATILAKGKTLAEAQLITPSDLIHALNGLPQDHLHCAELAVNTLQKAIENAKNRVIP